MKGAKELAKYFREEAERQFGYFGAEERRSVLSDTIAHLEAKAAIDSAVPVEVGEIAYRHATAEGYLAQHGELARPYGNEAHRNRATLLAIVQRQAADLTAARAEVERLKAERAALAQENARLINEVGTLDATAREQRQRAEVLARGVAAYRTGSYTLAQVWENEEGKAVT